MKGLILACLAVALAACETRSPKPPVPEEVGAELATFRQLFVPISTGAWNSMVLAAKTAPDTFIQPNQYANPYAHDMVLVGGRAVSASIAYTSVLLVPSGVPLESMSVLQYLRLFEHDAGAELARIAAPKGSIFLARDALPRVTAAASAAGAPAADSPYSVVFGTRQ